MAQRKSDCHGLPRIDGADVTILQASWHSDITDRMLAPCRELLVQCGASDPTIHRVPGSLELPIAAQTICRLTPRPEVIIAFGIILKGATDHYEVVRNECLRGLMDVMLREDMPIIVEVLPVLSLEQAFERSADNEFNKGLEAARAAVDIVSLRRTLRAS
ncbi:MAG: 6,7-dimethyl-8-ribityllumazine synthase [Bdellovibrionota bacterium]|nr:MAG: 6,7-dimethyl-8-ribityllumazine synthase [Bdellovibrionota bacterium]